MLHCEANLNRWWITSNHFHGLDRSCATGQASIYAVVSTHQYNELVLHRSNICLSHNIYIRPRVSFLVPTPLRFSGLLEELRRRYEGGSEITECSISKPYDSRYEARNLANLVVNGDWTFGIISKLSRSPANPKS
jgi:hypothetical protein